MNGDRISIRNKEVEKNKKTPVLSKYVETNFS